MLFREIKIGSKCNEKQPFAALFSFDAFIVSHFLYAVKKT